MSAAKLTAAIKIHKIIVIILLARNAVRCLIEPGHQYQFLNTIHAPNMNLFRL